MVEAAPSSNGSAVAAPGGKPTTKAAAQAAQMNKLRDANNKYKNLLKMAKERIQLQEEEMESLKRMFFVFVSGRLPFTFYLSLCNFYLTHYPQSTLHTIYRQTS